MITTEQPRAQHTIAQHSTHLYTPTHQHCTKDGLATHLHKHINKLHTHSSKEQCLYITKTNTQKRASQRYPLSFPHRYPLSSLNPENSSHINTGTRQLASICLNH